MRNTGTAVKYKHVIFQHYTNVTDYIQHEQINGCTYVRWDRIILIKEINVPVFYEAGGPAFAQGKAKIKLSS